MEAVIELNDKEGSSLNAIRKYINDHYDIRNQQKASFHNLTLKAVNKAVANNELERIKHSFKLSNAEKERRKEKLKGYLNADEVSLSLRVLSFLSLVFFLSPLHFLGIGRR
jgi:hypothetical protein